MPSHQRLPYLLRLSCTLRSATRLLFQQRPETGGQASAPLRKSALDFRVRRRMKQKECYWTADRGCKRRRVPTQGQKVQKIKSAAGSRSNAFQDPAKNFQRLNARRFTQRGKFGFMCTWDGATCVDSRAPSRHHPCCKSQTVSRRKRSAKELGMGYANKRCKDASAAKLNGKAS